MEPPPSRRRPPMDYGYDDYSAGDPYESYGPPPQRGGPLPGPGSNRYPGQREPVSFITSRLAVLHLEWPLSSE